MKRLFSDFIRYIDFNVQNCAREEVELKELWSVVIQSRSKSLKSLDCIPRIGENLPRIRGRRRYLRYLFEEILENSIKYSAKRPLEFRVDCETTPTDLVLTVTDNGLGVEQDELDTIFGLFQRLHPHGCYEGTGLGLALCRKIMRLDEGEIRARSNYPEPGLTLVLSFPRRVIL